MSAETLNRTRIDYGGVCCNSDQLFELDNGQVMVVVRREDIRRIVLKHGFQAPHPILQGGLGIVLTVLGCYPLVHLIEWTQRGGTLLSAEMWFIPLGIIGIVQAISAVQRGYFLEVDSEQGRKRLAFEKICDAGDVKKFVQTIETLYGMEMKVVP